MKGKKNKVVVELVCKCSEQEAARILPIDSSLYALAGSTFIASAIASVIVYYIEKHAK